MVSKCANSWCSTTRNHQEGKLFRLDIVVGNRAGGKERKTEYIWLCAPCADQMLPKVEVSGNTITLRLTKKDPVRVAETAVASERVN
jgi:hypothetical protein